MVRRFIGIFVLLVGIVVLSAGFYAPLHAQIYRSYLDSVDSLRGFSQRSLFEDRHDLTENVAQLLSSWFAWRSDEIAKYLPVTITGCTNEMDCYARCEELLAVPKTESASTDSNYDRTARAIYESQLQQLAFPGRGEIIASGSSTLFPLTEHMAQCYAYRTAKTTAIAVNGFKIQIASVGTRGNLDQFCVGEEDLHNASDLITSAQFLSHGCTDAFVADLVQLTVARDALVVVINRANPLMSVSLEERQLRFLLAYAETWLDVHPRGNGSTIVRYYPGLDSGTRTILADRLFADSGIAGGELLRAAKFVRPHENDRWAARQIARNPAATGFFGYRFYQEEQANLVALSINGIAADDVDHYPLARPLYLYTTKTKLAENPLLRDFLLYYLYSVDGYATNLGYFPITPADHQQEIARFEALLANLPGRG